MLNTPAVSGAVTVTLLEKSGAKSLMNATLVYGLTSVFDSTFPVNVKCCPLNVSVFSTYMLASMVLLPVEPGPPLGVYQNELVSLTEFGASVSVGPENVATRSGTPHPLPN